MAKKFNIDVVMNGTNNALPKREFSENIVSNDEDLKILNLRRKYFDVTTNTVLSIDLITNRIKSNADKIERFSKDIAMDIYFIYCGWNSFYKREDSFKDYIEKNLPFSRGYVYDIIKITNLLIEYQQKKKNIDNEKNVSYDTTLLLESLEPMEKIKIGKLKCVSQIKNEDKKYETLERVIEKDDLEEKDILQINKDELNKIRDNNINKSVIYLDGNNIIFNDKNIISFNDIDETLKTNLFEHIKKYLLGY